MRKLFLTSSSDLLYDHLQGFLEKPVDEVKIAWITTAKKGSPNKEYVEKHRKKMNQLGWKFTEIDIEGKTEEELRELLEDKDIIYMHGGNTFYLLRAIKAGIFEKVLAEKLDQGALYVGTSAGTYVACPTIEMAEWKRDRRYFRFEDQDLIAMGLVSFLVMVHFEPKHEEDIRVGMSKTDLDVYVLSDEQGLYVEDGEVRLVGKGDRIQLDKYAK